MKPISFQLKAWFVWTVTTAIFISSLTLLLVQTQVARWKAATPEQLTNAHLYLDIAKSGYLFYEFSSGVLDVKLIKT